MFKNFFNRKKFYDVGPRSQSYKTFVSKRKFFVSLTISERGDKTLMQ